jgi:ferric-dicitrate binding protein FerR (iron transport regulator)
MTTTQSDREDIAARWLIAQDDPAFSDEQREELARWLMQSIDNCDAYVQLVRAWRWAAILYRGEAPLVYGRRRKAAKGSTSRQPSSRTSLIDRGFGNLLRAHREERGLTQAELAARTGMRSSEISRLETGARTLTLTSTYVIARALGMSPSRLVSELESLLRGRKPGRKSARRRDAPGKV